MSDGDELKNEFAWSWSRHRTFYECPRKLYWQCYGSWMGWDPAAPPNAALAYRLKKIRSVAMLVGEVFHEVLAEVLARRPLAPQPVPAAQLRIDMERRLLKRIAESRNRDWQRYKNPKKYSILLEDYYGPGVDDALREQALADVRSCADGFAKSVYGRRAFAAPGERLTFIDRREFEGMRILVDGLTVFACPDLVVADAGGKTHIVDWKTGRFEKAEPAQLGVYALFVSEKFGVPIAEMTAHLVYVRTGGAEPHADLRPGVDLARRMMETYVSDVRGRLTDAPANVAGDVELFPMTTDLRKCRRCNFRELCGRADAPAQAPETGFDA